VESIGSLKMNNCYWRRVALSESPEGEYVRTIHPEVNFAFCRNKCSGAYEGECANFQTHSPRRLVEVVAERLEDIWV